MSDELKPCPYCRGTTLLVERLDYTACYVVCESEVGPSGVCGARGPIAVQDSDEEEEVPGYAGAVREWNRRPATDESAKPVEQIEDALDAIMKTGDRLADLQEAIDATYPADAEQKDRWRAAGHFHRINSKRISISLALADARTAIAALQPASTASAEAVIDRRQRLGEALRKKLWTMQGESQESGVDWPDSRNVDEVLHVLFSVLK